MTRATEVICRCQYDFANMRTMHVPACPLYPHGTPEHPPEVRAQIEGQELPQRAYGPATVLPEHFKDDDGAPEFVAPARNQFEAELSILINQMSVERNTPDFLLARFMEKSRQLFIEITDERDRWKNDNATVANFGFYVDGFTLHSTDTVGEIRVVTFDGRETTFPSKQLVAFLERRLSPPNIMPEN